MRLYDYLLPITYHLLPITYYLSPITYYLLPITFYKPTDQPPYYDGST